MLNSTSEILPSRNIIIKIAVTTELIRAHLDAVNTPLYALYAHTKSIPTASTNLFAFEFSAVIRISTYSERNRTLANTNNMQ